MLCRYVLTYVGMYSLEQGSEDVWYGGHDVCYVGMYLHM